MKKNYIVLQDGIKECGSACLLSIIRYYGGNISLEQLLELTNTNKEGTNFYDLAVASYEIGLNSKGYKINNIEEFLAEYKEKGEFVVDKDLSNKVNNDVNNAVNTITNNS